MKKYLKVFLEVNKQIYRNKVEYFGRKFSNFVLMFVLLSQIFSWYQLISKKEYPALICIISIPVIYIIVFTVTVKKNVKC